MPRSNQGLAASAWPWALAAAASLSFTASLAGMTFTGDFTRISQYFLVVQDAPILLFLCLFLAFVGFLATRDAGLAIPGWLRVERHGGLRVILLVSILVAVGVHLVGGLVRQDFGLTADEIMADFDARIIATGRLLAPVAPEWRDYVTALEPTFLLAVPENAFWISLYLPMNAALRAIFIVLGDPTWEGPFLAAIAIVALFAVARRLWPDRPDAAMVGAVLLVCSSQFLFMATTSYAMTAHLALNMVWLWLFLRDTRVAHGLAGGVAFVACGLHQVVFHPLFAVPFIASLVVGRRWKLAAYYVFAYALIGLFWISYWSLLLHGTSADMAQAADVGIAYFVRRIFDLVKLNSDGVVTMGLNLSRFMAWQNPLTMPLAAIGLLAFRDRNVAGLAAGIVLTLAATLVLLAFQGHGWGYRYLHGLLGSVSLLAAQGWVRLTPRGAAAAPGPVLALLSSIALSLVLLVPVRALQVRAFVKPYASAVDAIKRSRADVVVVDNAEIWYGADLVRNDPFLLASPKVMALTNLDELRTERLCRDHDVAIFGREDAERFGLGTMKPRPEVASHNKSLREMMRSLPCGRSIVGQD